MSDKVKKLVSDTFSDMYSFNQTILDAKIQAECALYRAQRLFDMANTTIFTGLPEDEDVDVDSKTFNVKSHTGDEHGS